MNCIRNAWPVFIFDNFFLPTDEITSCKAERVITDADLQELFTTFGLGPRILNAMGLQANQPVSLVYGTDSTRYRGRSSRQVMLEVSPFLNLTYSYLHDDDVEDKTIAKVYAAMILSHPDENFPLPTWTQFVRVTN